MATITQRSVLGSTTEEGVDEFNVAPPVGQRVRFKELLVGLGVVIGCAWGAVVLHLGSTQRDPVLALASSVQRGEVIEARDLRVVFVSSDEPFASIRRDEASTVIGRVAAGDLQAGTVLTRASVVRRAALAPTEGIVGLALEPGQYPASDVETGDVVNVVAASADGRASVGESGAEMVVAERAEVYAVDVLDSTGRRFVSLKLPQTAANRVAAAAGRGGLRLVQVGR